MDLTNEQLMDLLPAELVEMAFGDNSESPNTKEKIREWILSPQIAPLESRIHTYLLSKPPSEKPKPISFSSLFQHMDFEAEIKRVIQEISETITLFPSIQGEYPRFYKEIKQFLRKDENSYTNLN